MAFRRARKSSLYPAPGCSGRRWSVQGATCDPKLLWPEEHRTVHVITDYFWPLHDSSSGRVSHLSDDGLLTGVAASLLGRLYSLAAHVCAEGSEHMLERGGLGLARVAAVVFLPRAFLTVHVGTAFTSWAANLEIQMENNSLESFFKKKTTFISSKDRKLAFAQRTKWWPSGRSDSERLPSEWNVFLCTLIL